MRCGLPETRARPDCTHAVNALARVGHNPGKVHWQHLQHILHYISTTRNHKLALTKPNATEATDLRVYTDANYAPDWGTQYANYRSTSGYVSLANGSPLSWRSRRQTLTAQSSAESGYYGAADAAKEALKVARLLTCFMQKPVKPTLHIDNKSAISMSHSPSDQDATKHLDVRAHFLRECVRDGFEPGGSKRIDSHTEQRYLETIAATEHGAEHGADQDWIMRRAVDILSPLWWNFYIRLQGPVGPGGSGGTYHGVLGWTLGAGFPATELGVGKSVPDACLVRAT